MPKPSVLAGAITLSVACGREEGPSAGADPFTWPDNQLAVALDAWGAFQEAVAQADAAAAADAYDSGLAEVVTLVEARAGGAGDQDLRLLLDLGQPTDLVDAEAALRRTTWTACRALLDDAQAAAHVDDEAVLDGVVLAHDLFAFHEDLVEDGEARWDEDLSEPAEAGFLELVEGAMAGDRLQVGRGRYRVEGVAWTAAHRSLLDQLEAVGDDFVAQRRALGLFHLLAPVLTGEDGGTPTNSWGAVEAEDLLVGPLALLDEGRVWAEVDQAFAKRSFGAARLALDDGGAAVGTTDGALAAWEGGAAWQVVVPGVDAAGVDAAALVDAWQAYAESVEAGDASTAAERARPLADAACAYLVALGASSSTEACSALDGPTFVVELDPATEPSHAWSWDDAAPDLANAWRSGLHQLQGDLQTATTEGALDHEALEGAYAGWKTLAPLAEEVDPDRVEIVEEAFACLSVQIQAGDDRQASACRETVDKSVYAPFHHATVAWAEEAASGDDAEALERAAVAYAMIQSRVVDTVNPELSKNSAGDTIISAMLAGDPADADAREIQRQLDVAFAKWSLRYTVHGLPVDEGGEGLAGTTEGYVLAVKGKAWWSIYAADTSEDVARIAAVWDHWAGDLHKVDLEDGRWASAELLASVCGYMLGELGLASCDDEDIPAEGARWHPRTNRNVMLRDVTIQIAPARGPRSRAAPPSG